MSSAQIQEIHIHKYTNTAYEKSARKTQHVVYILKEDCSRRRIMVSMCVKLTNTKDTKNTNTQIQHMTKCQIDPGTQHVVYF